METDPPRNRQPETHTDDERGCCRRAGASIGWKGFPMPLKTHKEVCQAPASFAKRHIDREHPLIPLPKLREAADHGKEWLP